MLKINDIKKSINTDFSEILNQYDAFLEFSKDIDKVLDETLIKSEVQELIELIRIKGIKRVPYDSITTRVIDFNAKFEESEGLEESFNFLINQTNTALISIINDLLTNKKFGDVTVSAGLIYSYDDSIVAFYKLFEHTKLANSQYQVLYQKTENEVSQLNNDVKSSEFELSKLRNTIVNQTTESQELLINATNELEEIKKTKTSIYTDFIAILGVFASFVFVMFGGFTALSKIIETLSNTNVSLTKTLLVSSILFGFLITVLYSLLYWISLIIDKPIFNRSCDCEKKPCTSYKHLFIKHRYYLIVIGTCLAMFLVSVILIFLKIY
ncbi:hypothetical protein [Streptococcus parauberis]|uniref:hypothetical protein n=1 Tax=Streptococcus parauberis TaxID=1348 RepID=UPI0002BAAC1A|nr:hypothetical protein [Streptococcus parauberis]EMF48567.1 putative phage membrane protein [Streptococcus parauberis KRS-02109]QBX09916.1 hypothetical protein JavanS397_0018 [Streptococcus satellite phage Javan397]UWM86761.1 hypothetical protein N2A93_09205 [Streptococcus parauberis]UWM88733.1 hypothetical protein N2A96_09205 [Streptococcus parauberis]